MRIIGLCGPIGSGKTTVARELACKMTDARVLSFATPIKHMTMAMLRCAGITGDAAHILTYGEGRNQPLDVLQGRTTRQVQQWLGTEFGRNLVGRGLWTDIAMAQAASGNGTVIIDDVRFPSELAAIEDRGGDVIGLSRDGVAYDTSHSSEQRLPVSYVSNNGTPSDTARRVLELLS